MLASPPRSKTMHTALRLPITELDGDRRIRRREGLERWEHRRAPFEGTRPREEMAGIQDAECVAWRTLDSVRRNTNRATIHLSSGHCSTEFQSVALPTRLHPQGMTGFEPAMRAHDRLERAGTSHDHRPTIRTADTHRESLTAHGACTIDDDAGLMGIEPMVPTVRFERTLGTLRPGVSKSVASPDWATSVNCEKRRNKKAKKRRSETTDARCAQRQGIVETSTALPG